MTQPPETCPVCAATLPAESRSCPACGAFPTIVADRSLHPYGRVDAALVRERIVAFRGRLEREPGDLQARSGLAVALANTGDLDAAAGELVDALALAPDDARLHVARGAVLADLVPSGRRGAERDAWEHVERALALALEPDRGEALLLKARLLLARDDWQGALDAVRSALAGSSAGMGTRFAGLLVNRAEALAARDEWLAALPLWREAAAIAPDRARPAMLETLRREQVVLLSRPRWSWLVYPPAPDRQRSFRYAAAAFVAAVACLLLFVVFAAHDETLILGVAPLLGTIVAPIAILFVGRRRLRERAAPHGDLVARIRANPASIFRGEPSLGDLLAALDYVAAERQGQAMAREHPWLIGRGSAVERRARRGALLRAPWMPSGDDDPARRG